MDKLICCHIMDRLICCHTKDRLICCHIMDKLICCYIMDRLICCHIMDRLICCHMINSSYFVKTHTHTHTHTIPLCRFAVRARICDLEILFRLLPKKQTLSSGSLLVLSLAPNLNLLLWLRLADCCLLYYKLVFSILAVDCTVRLCCHGNEHSASWKENCMKSRIIFFV